MRIPHPRLLLVSLAAIFAVLAILWAPGRHAGTRSAPTFSKQVSGPTSQPAVASETNATPSPATALAKPVSSNSDLLASLRAVLAIPNVVPGEALLTFRSREALDRFTRAAAGGAVETLGVLPQLNAARVRYGSLENLRDLLAATPAGDAAVEGNLWLAVPPPAPQPDLTNEGGTAPFGREMLAAINAAGDRRHWGENITVAVLDTGVLAHPTFGTAAVMHLDLVNDGQPFHSHGTSIASLIVGRDPQAPGVAPGARLLDIRVANAEGYTVSSLLAQGIIAATDRGAQVINISLGGYGESPLLQQALGYAAQRGAVVVAAAGNDAYSQLAVPASYSGVISVGSVDAQNRQAYFSNSGEGLTLAAPGVGVISAWETDKIALTSGTSQSSALVSAAAAAYLGWGVSSNAVAARLRSDARPATTGGVRSLLIKPPSGR